MDNHLTELPNKKLAGFQQQTHKNSLIVAQSLHSTEKELIEAFTSHELIHVLVERNQESASVEFRNLIFRCVSICSIKNKPDELTLSVLWDYTKKNLSNYTLKEIEKAVIFNQSGQLADTIDHFHVFDIAFFSKVMDLWLILKNQTRNRIAALLPKPKDPELETPEQRYQGLLNYINLNQKFPEFWAWEAVFKHMEDVGVINESLESKRLLFNEIKVKLEVKQEMDLMNVADFIERERITSGLTDRVIAECRKITVQKYLSHLITT